MTIPSVSAALSANVSTVRCYCKVFRGNVTGLSAKLKSCRELYTVCLAGSQEALVLWRIVASFHQTVVAVLLVLCQVVSQHPISFPFIENEAVQVQ